MNHIDSVRIKSHIPGDDAIPPIEEEEEDQSNNNIQNKKKGIPIVKSKIKKENYSTENTNTNTNSKSNRDNNSNSIKSHKIFNTFIDNTTSAPLMIQKQYTKFSTVQSNNIKIKELMQKRASYFDVVKTRKMFHKFLCIGIDKSGLDSIEDIDEMSLNPKITFNYPENADEKDLQFNLVFLKNSCFKEAVKVKRFYVDNDDDFTANIFERNFFADFKSSFCLLQPVTPADDKKAFIFGVQFDDLFILNTKNRNTKNVFIYEKTYLFIANEPLCKLFDQMIKFILRYKKLNFYQHLESFDSLLNKETLKHLQMKNDEKSSESILEILQYFFDRSYPRNDEYISFQSTYSQLTMNYKHPNQSNEVFLASNYLYSNLFKHSPPNLIYTLIIRILLEQNCLFVIDNIQTLTLGFYYIIQPFTWPFTIIPNLPLDLCEVIESPVPYIIGVLGDKKIAEGFKRNPDIKSNIIVLEKNVITIVEQLPLLFSDPPMDNLCKVISSTLSKAQYALSQKLFDEYEQSCELIYKNIYGIIKGDISDSIEHIIKNSALSTIAQSQNSIEFTTESLIKYKHNDDSSTYGDDNNESDIEYINSIKKLFISKQKAKNMAFAKAFSQTQIFAVFVDKIIEDKSKGVYYNSSK